MRVEWEVQIRLKYTYEALVMRAVLESIVKAIKVRATKRHTNYDTNGFIINLTVLRVFKYRQMFDFISSVSSLTRFNIYYCII